MRSYTLTAPAKINLYLEIIGDRPDGYHELAMIMQSIGLADQIEIEANDVQLIRFRCDSKEVPVDRSNLVYRAADLMVQEFPDSFATYGGVDITLHKHIPVAAGLAGGSTDAAAVLVGIDLLWKLGLTKLELEELAAKIGSDIPFCIGGGTAIATGRGEILSPLLGLHNTYIVLAKYRSLEVSTPWAYKTYRSLYSDSYVTDKESLSARANAVHSGEIVKAISHQNASEVAQKMHNDLEKVVLPEYPQVLQLKESFAKYDILGTMMSGSGPSVFALCDSKDKAEEVKLHMRNEIPSDDLELFVTQLINYGIQVR
ncbi:4-diphosphocytidyl-2-C-methyl-D-erythritol kinase [Rivularia sp. PCC 7116]|uniref:4-(cytidine 5'-diphospho)-2-C-methyl-D-erythritol kinase n=1 Tax=Rivularia sp. PCC 7116 TaxID=373994 RepID=UPI00029F155D|nr:4-(cytidine 5'-diphospho)-2-C-methyl-D-erythritol kinase [Rivularia sp. PCC 7116]AFY56774.1 4-diphosphocytidyl-2-C-methyl-D-erythritol kinase [Rivularia sp. PCC 7116]